MGRLEEIRGEMAILLFSNQGKCYETDFIRKIKKEINMNPYNWIKQIYNFIYVVAYLCRIYNIFIGIFELYYSENKKGKEKHNFSYLSMSIHFQFKYVVK